MNGSSRKLAVGRSAIWAAALLLLLTGLYGFVTWDRRLPRIVFAARATDHAPEIIPGFGPRGRTDAPGGRLMVRERDGRLRELVPAATFHDVSDPAVSYDGTRIAFAAATAPDAAWRIWLVHADGSGLRQVTYADRDVDLSRIPDAPPSFEHYDDFDPCWLPNGAICFASTRLPQLSQQGHMPVSNLFVVDPDGGRMSRITTERNGAEEPAVDPRDGRIVFARWWFNPYLASDVEALGVTTDPARAVPADTVNLWHAIVSFPDGDGMQLAGGDPRDRAGQQAYQPLVLADGTLVGVAARYSALDPDPGDVWLAVHPGGFAAAEPRHAGDAVVSPAELPDGRLLASVRHPATGRFQLEAFERNGVGPAIAMVRLPGEHVLDAAVIAPRPVPPVLPTGRADGPPDLPETRADVMKRNVPTFRFDCLNVFANAPVDAPFPDAVPMQRDVRIRFYTTVARPGHSAGDSVVLLREAPVLPSGAVHQDDMPADLPMFEQLVDAEGRVLRSSAGPAHVPGANFGREGSGTKCVGCHVGHSAIEVPINYSRGKWTNAAPSAEVTASSEAAGTQGARAAVDRRAEGSAADVAWIAEGPENEWIRLSWRWPVEVRAVVLYPCSQSRSEATDLRVGETGLSLYRNGVLQRKLSFRRTLESGGTRFEFDPIEVDALEIRPDRMTGFVLGRRAAALAEIEAIARLVED